MTEWNAPEYARISALQQAMAAEALSLADLQGTERVLDLGCGNGRITAGIAERLKQGSIVGVDASAEMIAFASEHFPEATFPNLRFQMGDIRRLTFREEFDGVVSFNALHWIPEQSEALRTICSAMKKGACAQLRLVPKGRRKSLEDVIEETRKSQRWSEYFNEFHDPYLHLTLDEYSTLAEENGLRVRDLEVKDKAWNFGSRAGFAAFGAVTFVEWTKHLPENGRPPFVADVLDRYSKVAGDESTFRFYQMDIRLIKN
ncbi:MAG TPA: class I SAM-dependent methyltransferase [Edaphobacter sp.]|jgi:trans-aconitate 2-methyltransferase|nr:class I SAM-dependent methyltransferase [Edaphobacter sp.]